jgi:hypothetical protein
MLLLLLSASVEQDPVIMQGTNEIQLIKPNLDSIELYQSGFLWSGLRLLCQALPHQSSHKLQQVCV